MAVEEQVTDEAAELMERVKGAATPSDVSDLLSDINREITWRLAEIGRLNAVLFEASRLAYRIPRTAKPA